MLRHIDCFSGVGGIATGFRAANSTTVLAIEKVASCVETYRANHPEVPVIQGDIRAVNAEDLNQHGVRSVDLVTAGMPCETFSTAGASSRSFYDHRQMLFDEAIRIAELVEAPLILFENVPGLANKRVSKESSELVIDVIKSRLSKRGYSNIFTTILNSSDYGLPQSRNRLFILASRYDDIELSAPPAVPDKVTVGDAFANLPYVDVNGPFEAYEFLGSSNPYCDLMSDASFWKMPLSGSCSYQKSPKHRPATIERFKLIRTGEGLKSLFDRLSPSEIARLQQLKILPKKWYIQRNRRLDANDLSPTVTSHCIDELLHPTLNRAITVREAARLQGFPDSYDFVGGPEICPHMYETQDKYEQIGDAVPPLMAYHWANHIMSLIAEYGSVDARYPNARMR